MPAKIIIDEITRILITKLLFRPKLSDKKPDKAKKIEKTYKNTVRSSITSRLNKNAFPNIKPRTRNAVR